MYTETADEQCIEVGWLVEKAEASPKRELLAVGGIV